jgi:nitronate monooxygenase
MWPDRRLIDLFRIEHPIVLAPMAGAGSVALAAAVGEAGGLGSVGCGPLPPAAVAETIQALRGLSRGPININFFCHVRPASTKEGLWPAWISRRSAMPTARSSRS